MLLENKSSQLQDNKVLNKDINQPYPPTPVEINSLNHLDVAVS